MEIFNPGDKLVSLIRKNYNLLPVINRFGIRLGFKDKSIDEICIEHNTNTAFFLAIVNTYHNENYFPEQKLLSFSPLEIIAYLKSTHEYYLRQVIPALEDILTQLLESCSEPCDDLKLIEKFYQSYKDELIHHIKEEEEIVFPYVEELLQSKKISDTHPGIHAFEKEHSNVEIKLNDLKNLMLKYINPTYDQMLCNEFLSLLFKFEKDIIDHARIEDKILVPMVQVFENKYRSEG